MSRPSVAASPDHSGGEVEVEPLKDTATVDARSEYPSGAALTEMDDMDAAEAAQFKADVQGHRLTEVRTVSRRRDCCRMENICSPQIHFSAHIRGTVSGTAMLAFAVVLRGQQTLFLR